MTRLDLDHARVVRAWLEAGGEELSPRVRENVLREFPATNQDTPHWAASWPQVSSFAVGAVLGAAAVTVVVAVMGAELFGRFQPGGAGATATPIADAPSPTPKAIDYSYRDVGFNGLHPLGATPSDATHTELVEMFLRPGGLPYRGAAFLYADGRLIWNEYFGEANMRSTGWLEQTLTHEGIELVRALARETWGANRLNPEELPGRLPDSAWVDKAVRPYVPSGYAACVFVSEQVNPFTESKMTQEEILAALPLAAVDLLRDSAPVVDGSDSYGADPFDCLGIDVADARRLDAALRAAGFEQNGLMYHTVLERPEAGTWWLNVWYEPILPDGTVTCSNCG